LTDKFLLDLTMKA